LIAPIEPGSESLYANRTKEIERLRGYGQNLNFLCCSLNDVDEVVTFDKKFAPREFLRQKLKYHVRRYIRQNSETEIDPNEKIPEKFISRPTILEKKLIFFLQLLNMLNIMLTLI